MRKIHGLSGKARLQALTLYSLLLFSGVGLLIAALSLPLARRRVKPSYIYGFRTPKSLSSEAIWYEANAYAGRLGVWAGLFLMAAAVVLYFVFRANFITYNVAFLVVLLGTLAVHVGLSLRYLRSL